VSGINPQPGPVISGTGTGLSYQNESPLLVVKQQEAITTIDQQRFHDEALQWYGEQCIVRQLWRFEDQVNGLVGYCLTCQDSPNPTMPSIAIQNRVSNVYKQTGNSYCPDCYGTTFSGGFKPICYHTYMVAQDAPQVRNSMQTGQFWRDNPQVQFSWFPEIREGDLVVRVEQWSNGVPVALGDRFIVNVVNPQTIRTGPGVSYNTNIYISQSCTLESFPTSHPYYNVPII